jgi:DNA polymerase-1
MDRMMLQAFRENKDLHSFSATLMYHEDYDNFVHLLKEQRDQETKRKRQTAKVVSFASLYGSGPNNLAKKLRLTLDEGRDVLDRYWEAYPDLAEAMPRYGKFANKHGYSNTILGRRRYYHAIQEKMNHVRLDMNPASIERRVRDLGMHWLLEDGPVTEDNMKGIKDRIISKFRGEINRQAGNHLIQGSAADATKLCAVNLHTEFKARKLNSVIAGLVHDEVIVEVPDEEITEVEPLVIEKMKEAQLAFCPNVPAEVEGEISPHWKK